MNGIVPCCPLYSPKSIFRMISATSISWTLARSLRLVLLLLILLALLGSPVRAQRVGLLSAFGRRCLNDHLHGI